MRGGGAVMREWNYLALLGRRGDDHIAIAGARYYATAECLCVMVDPCEADVVAMYTCSVGRRSLVRW